MATSARGRGPGILVLLGLLGLLLALALAGQRAVLRAWYGAGPLPEARHVIIPRGGVDAVADALVRAGVIEDSGRFLLGARLTRAEGPLRAGEFVFPAGASLRDAFTVLRTATPVQRRITLPEGLTTAQAMAILARTPGLVDEPAPPPEGSLFPDTYAFEWGASRAEIVARARRAMDRALAEAWEARAENLPLASPREALILASIVERETARAEERARVAGVFINRLRRNMPLQSDPTVVYAASGGFGVLDRPISRADLDLDNPFNTYRNRGLPPGPIAAPGLASIRATLAPEAHDFLFFVADGTGGHAFARTLEEHNRNVARWREIERQRGSATPGAASPAPATAAPPASGAAAPTGRAPPAPATTGRTP